MGLNLRYALLALATCAPRISERAPDAVSLPHHAASSAPIVSATYAIAPAEVVAFTSGALTLHGFLWRPVGSGRFPAIVFNHGSEEYPGDMSGQAQFYVPHGYVLFVPHRRGHGRSHDAGPYIGDITMQFSAVVAALEEQSDDVLAAVTYVAGLPNVDAKHIAVAGCSFGGIEALLAAERGTGITSAIDFAGGSMAWASNLPLRARMKTAAENVKVPIFFIQAENDFNTTPTRELSEAAREAGRVVRSHVFPPNGTTAMDGHAFCRGGDHPKWGDEVLEFLRAR